MSNNQQKRKALESENPTDVEEEEEEEVKELEREVREIGERILHFRSTVPELLKKTLESSLRSTSPLLSPSIHAAESSIVQDRHSDAGENIELRKGAPVTEEDPDIAGKIILLKSKISSNISAMPVILKRMNECIAAIDKLDKCNIDIHPAFKRKRPNE